MRYYDLKEDRYYEEKENRGLVLLYNNALGRLFLKLFISKPVRKAYCKYMSSKYSKGKIKKFILSNNIDMETYEKKDYNSFNDFFIRKIKDDKRPISDGLIAVADSKLTVYKIDKNSSFKIKNSIYTINELLRDKVNDYEDGYALVFRLCVDDYHHYVFPDDGVIIDSKEIDGVLHTVQPIAFKKYRVFHENSRTITNLKCKKLGKVCYIEVGAMMIGKIVNEKITKFKKGDEKGHFEFGGSTIILLVQKDKIKINPKILENSKKGIETVVKLGDKIS